MKKRQSQTTIDRAKSEVKGFKTMYARREQKVELIHVYPKQLRPLHRQDKSAL